VAPSPGLRRCRLCARPGRTCPHFPILEIDVPAPNPPHRIEEVLTKFYRASDQNREWQAIWDRVCEILEQKNEALVERCKALVPVLQQITGMGQIV